MKNKNKMKSNMYEEIVLLPILLSYCLIRIQNVLTYAYYIYGFKENFHCYTSTCFNFF